MNILANYPNPATAPLTDIADWLTAIGGNANRLRAVRTVRVDTDGVLHDDRTCTQITGTALLDRWDPCSGNLNNVCRCLTTISNGQTVARCSHRQQLLLERLAGHLADSRPLSERTIEQLSQALNSTCPDSLDVPELHRQLHTEAMRRISEDATNIIREHFHTRNFHYGDLNNIVPSLTRELGDELMQRSNDPIADIGSYLTDPATQFSLLRSHRLRTILHRWTTGDRSPARVPTDDDPDYYPDLLNAALNIYSGDIEQYYRLRTEARDRVLRWTSANVCLIDVSFVDIRQSCGPGHPAVTHGPRTVCDQHGIVLFAVVPASVAVASDAVLRQHVFDNDAVTSSDWSITVTDLDDTVMDVIIELLHGGASLSDAHRTAVSLYSPTS
jgi:hypothetical protein